ncbi:type II secretion system minor pseudopilin GspK [Vreelandella sp. GE22]
MKTQRGVALLLALWVLALASLLLGSLAVSVQLQQRQSLWQRDQTQALLAAEAGLGLAVAGLMQNEGRWQADGEVQQVPFAGAELAISVQSERGKLDLNAAPKGDVEKLMAACGASGPQAERIATALERRRSDTPLRLLEELRALPEVSYALYECAQAHVTVWSGNPQPDPVLASPWLARVLGLPRRQGEPIDAGQIVTVTSAATLPSGFHSRLTVTLVMLNTLTAGAKPYRVLRWQE